MATPEDWLKSSRKQRKDMYQCVRHLIRVGELTWDNLYKIALGRIVSESFNENFRQGRLSGKDAVRIYRYLQSHYRESAQALDAEAFTAKKFSDFLLRYRRLGLLEILPWLVDIPQRTNRLGPEWREYPFETEEPILFRLRLPLIYGFGMALHGSGDGWFPLVLDTPNDFELDFDDRPPWLVVEENDLLIKPVRAGAQTIGAPPRTRAEMLRRRGANIFVFIVGEFETLLSISARWHPDVPLRPDQLDALADELMATQNWAIAQLNASGMGPLE